MLETWICRFRNFDKKANLVIYTIVAFILLGFAMMYHIVAAEVPNKYVHVWVHLPTLRKMVTCSALHSWSRALDEGASQAV